MCPLHQVQCILGWQFLTSTMCCIYVYDAQGRGESSRRKAFYERELIQYSQQVSSEMEARSGEVASLLNSSDAILSEAREIDVLFAQMMSHRLGGEDATAGFVNIALVEEEEMKMEAFEGDADIKSLVVDAINWKGAL